MRATVGGTRDRRTYTWSNGGTRYQAIWQPRDPDFIRVRVLSPVDLAKATKAVIDAYRASDLPAPEIFSFDLAL